MRVIGLDPGQHTGVAHFDDGQLVKLTTTAPAALADMLDEHQPGMLVFEDSRLQSHTWARSTNVAAMRKIARNVGQVDAWCDLISQLCVTRHIPFVSVSPKAKGRKLGASAFAQICGWTRRSNQHERDAAMVAWRYRYGFQEGHEHE